MRILGIESSSLVASVAVVTDDTVTAEYTVNFKKTHSQTLLPMLDEVAKMIELAGGEYVPSHIDETEKSLSTMNMQMEAFYAAAKDADCLIYNGTIDGELEYIDQLLAKDSLLADFKAVKEGNVWCAGKDMFQETLGAGDMIEDIRRILEDEDPDPSEMVYIHKLKER